MQSGTSIQDLKESLGFSRCGAQMAQRRYHSTKAPGRCCDFYICKLIVPHSILKTEYFVNSSAPDVKASCPKSK